MGMDKEATDIWVFGRKRPDLSMEETVKASQTFRWDDLSPQEQRRRDKALSKHKNLRIRKLLNAAPDIIQRAKAQEQE